MIQAQVPASGCQTVLVPAGPVTLRGQMLLPDDARALVIFVGGCDGASLQLHELTMIEALRNAGIGYLLMNLLTDEEEAQPGVAAYCHNNIELLASRVVGATDWLSADRQTESLPLGYLATHVGAAVALVSAANRPAVVRAVVSSCGRPFLARAALPQVRSPTLLLVPASNDPLVKVNRAAFAQLICEKRLALVPDDCNLALLNQLAVDWFKRYLVRS